jgi:hypothetical protein
MSPDLKDVLSATIPSILPGVLVGVGILNKYDISALRADVKSDIARIDGRIDRIETKIDSLSAALNGMIDTLSKQLNEAIPMLVNISNEMDKRVSRLEDKS